jgi:hypothetical protein
VTAVNLPDLMTEYERALAYTDDLWRDLTREEIHWRPHKDSSAVGWHLGHQPAVAHFMVRNLTAAEPNIDAKLDRLMDGATSEPDRDGLPDPERLAAYRKEVSDRVRFRVGNIERGEVGAPTQLRFIAETMMTAIINHEYQHSKWIGETRSDVFGYGLPEVPTSDLLTMLDGYQVVGTRPT